MKLPLTIFVFVASIATSAKAITFVQWGVGSGGNGHFYGITDAASDWNVAESAALSAGGHLASITSSAEQAFIETTFLTGAFDLKPLWIGLADANVEGTFVWTTGEAVSFTNWNAPTGEPNNDLGNEDYGTINWHRAENLGGPKGTWNDTPLNGTTIYGGNTTGPYFGLVEVVPEPSSAVLAAIGALGLVLSRNRRSA